MVRYFNAWIESSVAVEEDDVSEEIEIEDVKKRVDSLQGEFWSVCFVYSMMKDKAS